MPRKKRRVCSPEEKSAILRHTDIAYISLGGTFYDLISVLDGYSRFLVHWEIQGSMTEMDVEIVLQRAPEGFPGFNPRIISDNGSALSPGFQDLHSCRRHEPRPHITLLSSVKR